jgi:hypothetical protein
MVQEDFQLAGSTFGVDQFDGDVLLLQLVVQVAEEFFPIVQRDRIDIDRIIDKAPCFGIEQTEFEFDAHRLRGSATAAAAAISASLVFCFETNNTQQQQ